MITKSMKGDDVDDYPGPPTTSASLFFSSLVASRQRVGIGPSS